MGDWYIYNYLNIVPDKISDAIFVFHISIFTAALSTLFVPFQGLQVAYENLLLMLSSILSHSPLNLV